LGLFRLHMYIRKYDFLIDISSGRKVTGVEFLDDKAPIQCTDDLLLIIYSIASGIFPNTAKNNVSHSFTIYRNSVFCIVNDFLLSTIA
jgi:hypothetical protein